MPIAQNPKTDQAPKKRPAAEFRDSNLKVTIWPAAGKNGIIHYNVILTRNYQSKGKWEATPYLGKLDLQRGIKLLNRADDWIFNTAGRKLSVGIKVA